jgi:hypothetical protein
VTSTLVALVSGRHRLGLPGLQPLASFASVHTRGMVRRLFYRGRHRSTVPTMTGTAAPAARPAV